MVRAIEGRVFFEGADVSKTEAWKSRVGAYLDEHMLLAFLTAEEYFDSLRKLYDLSKEDLAQHLEKFRSFFNDEIFGKKKYIRDLSKGNVKKVGIAAALLGGPSAM